MAKLKHKKLKKHIKSAQEQVGGKVNAGLMDGICFGGGICEDAAEPDCQEYHLGFEDGGFQSFAHAVNEDNNKQKFDYKKYMLSLLKYMEDDGFQIKPYPKVAFNHEEQNGLFIKTGYYLPSEKKVVLFTAERHPKDIMRSFAHELIHHHQNLIGKNLNFGEADSVENSNELEELEAEAYLKGNIYFRKWTEHVHKNGKEMLSEGSWGYKANDSDSYWDITHDVFVPAIRLITKHLKDYKKKYSDCYAWMGLANDLFKEGDVLKELSNELQKMKKAFDEAYDFYISDTTNANGWEDFEKFKTELGKLKKEFDSNCKKHEINESNIKELIKPEDVDLSSFQIQSKLNDKFWVDGHLDSRIRMKLFDIADDFMDEVGLDESDIEDIIITGSIANYNWSKNYSDIDLHIVVNFDDLKDDKELLKKYFDSARKIWNEEHEGIKIYGFPVEIYVQDINEPHKSSGVYSIDKDKWITEPDDDELSDNHFSEDKVKETVSKFTDKIDKLCVLTKKAGDDSYKLRKLYVKSKTLFDKIKQVRASGLKEENPEMSNGNIIFKALRRNNYIEKLLNLRTKIYNMQNSLT